MNRKGHTPTIFLLVATIILISYSLFVFVTFDKNISVNSGTYSDLVDGYKFKEAYFKKTVRNVVSESIGNVKGGNFVDNLKSEIIKIANEKDIRARSIVGNLYGKLGVGDFEIIESEDNFELTVEGVFIKSESKNNELRKDFNLIVDFDENGFISIRFINVKELDLI